jgi:histidine triad (HIT) family protein
VRSDGEGGEVIRTDAGAPDCAFCKIVAGELPARVLYADEAVVSFLDIAPATSGHALVVPRAHRRDLWEVDDDELVAVSLVARRVATALRDVLAAPGIWLHQVSGEAAGQDVFHYHVHVIPRYDGDTVQPGWGTAPWHPPALTDTELDRMAARVGAILAPATGGSHRS